MGYFNPYWVITPNMVMTKNREQHDENGAFDNGAST
jgi:hypothetical protein